MPGRDLEMLLFWHTGSKWHVLKLAWTHVAAGQRSALGLFHLASHDCCMARHLQNMYSGICMPDLTVVQQMQPLPGQLHAAKVPTSTSHRP